MPAITEEKVLNRFAELRRLGAQVLQTRRPPPPNFFTSDFVDNQLANQWLLSCQSLLGRVLGQESPHAKRLATFMTPFPKWPDVEAAYGVLLAAEDDVRSGALDDVRVLIEAEIFDDFLEQAQHLLDAGYYQPAVVMTGAVLEDALRKHALRLGVDLPPKPKLDTINSLLAKTGAYTLLVQKQITALADIRNNAAHGQWSAFSDSDARRMLSEVRDILQRHLS